MTPATPTTDAPRLVHVPALDGLRAVAVLVVFASHADLGVPGGSTGVYLFFSLSGFLITSLLLQEHARHGRIDLVAFWVRRALRLLPAVLVMVGVVTLAAVTVTGIPRAAETVDGAPAALFYYANWARAFGQDEVGLGLFEHTWSLAVEEQFYVVWPLVLVAVLARFGGPRAVLGVALTGAALAVAARLLVTDEPDAAYPRLYNGTDTQADHLLLGAALAAALMIDGRWRTAVRRVIGVALAPAVLVLVAAVLATPDRATSDTYRVGLTIVAVSCAVVVGAVYLGGRPFGRILGSRPLVWIGVRSYALYLWHYPIVMVLRETGLDTGRWWAVVLAVSLAAADLSYRVVEQPFLRLKDRWPSGSAHLRDGAHPEAPEHEGDDVAQVNAVLVLDQREHDGSADGGLTGDGEDEQDREHPHQEQPNRPHAHGGQR